MSEPFPNLVLWNVFITPTSIILLSSDNKVSGILPQFVPLKTARLTHCDRARIFSTLFHDSLRFLGPSQDVYVKIKLTMIF